MQDNRPTAEEMLKCIKASEEKAPSNYGHLKIFFGYAAGVGKTYAMLKSAHNAKRRGVDVVIGYVEPHQRPETSALIQGLEKLPEYTVEYKGITLNEFDLDKALERKPSLILVDELAHSNAETCRHAKRYQDIEELLRHGIDVYTTVNVQHIESLNDIVESITGIQVRERIPDYIFDDSSQVELVDIEPQELLERLVAGKIYKENQAQKALSNFFDIKNLTALREIALRRCADRVNKMAEAVRFSKSNAEYYTDEHILVCLSSSPTNAKNIRAAARMAHAFHATFTALFVETGSYNEMSEENKTRLRNNMRLAQQLGAGIETVTGEDVPLQIAEFARLSGVSKIVLGKSNVEKKYFWSKPPLTEQLAEKAPFLEIYIIPEKSAVYKKKNLEKVKIPSLNFSDFCKSFMLLIGATAIGYGFYKLNVANANIIIVYLLSVLLTAIVTSSKIYSLLFSVLSVLLYNFFFTVPRFSLHFYDTSNLVTFGIMFVIAFIMSSLVGKIKQNEASSVSLAYRTGALLETNQCLQKIHTNQDIIEVLAEQLIKLLNKDIVVYLANANGLQKPQVYWVNDYKDELAYINENEKAVAYWVYKNNKHAGATTNTLSRAKCLYLAVRVNERVYGVVGIAMENNIIPAFESSIMLSVIGECALAFENLRINKEKEESSLLAKKEQLRANLLRAISHDLRTPLTSISGNADILLSGSEKMSLQTKQQMYSAIYDDATWLNNLVENLLSVTRLEDGSLQLNTSTELMEDVITEALQHVNRRKVEYSITTEYSEPLILVEVDARLIMQVIINIVDNAIKYTDKGSSIHIAVTKTNGFAIVEISDNGKGIADKDKEKIFDMFYTANLKIVDSRRSLGLGLSLCKSIIVAHGGEISVHDTIPHGTTFKFTVPAREVKNYEE